MLPPASLLFACSFNAVRSPMAVALMRRLHGRHVWVDSVGLRAGELDPMAAEVMEEIGLSLAGHRPKSFEQLEDGYFDLVISLCPEAHHRAVEMTRDSATQIELWPMPDPTWVEGSRSQRLDAFRDLRDRLARRLGQRYPPPDGAPPPSA